MIIDYTINRLYILPETEDEFTAVHTLRASLWNDTEITSWWTFDHSMETDDDDDPCALVIRMPMPSGFELFEALLRKVESVLRGNP